MSLSPSSSGGGRRTLKLTLLVAVVSLAMVLLRVGIGGQRALQAGEQALAAGDEARALRHFEASAHWYLPGAPWVEAALSQMWQLGEARLARGDTAGGLEALFSVRSGILGTRSFYVPNRPWLDRADAAIAEVQVADPDAVWPDRSQDPAAREAEARRALAAWVMPDPGWSALAVFSFLGWVGAAVGLILRGFEPTGALRRKPALRWVGAIVLGFSLWIIGMALA